MRALGSILVYIDGIYLETLSASDENKPPRLLYHAPVLVFVSLFQSKSF